MTLPDERYRAVMWAKRFLESVAYKPSVYPRVPKYLRREANSILRHFPSEWDLQQAAEKAPSVFQEKMEPLYRMVKQHEQDKQDV
jgi:hypothetical protein